ncbi:MAG: hypothetical protein WC277_04870 [Bacilli bacterium]
MIGHFEGGRWITDPPAPIEPLVLTVKFDTAELERKLDALAAGLCDIALGCQNLRLALKMAGDA